MSLLLELCIILNLIQPCQLVRIILLRISRLDKLSILDTGGGLDRPRIQTTMNIASAGFTLQSRIDSVFNIKSFFHTLLELSLGSW